MLMPTEIARMEEARQARAMTEIGLTCEPIMGGVMSYLEPGSWANQACGVGLNGPVTEDDIERLVAYYTTRGVEPRVELAQFADASLIAGLGRRGFDLRQFETVLARPIDLTEDMMAKMLGDWPRDDAGNRLVIERVEPDDEAMVLESFRVSMSGFMPPGYVPSEAEIGMHRKIVAHPHSEYLVARFGSDVVGAGGVEYPRDDEIPVGVLFGVSVLTKFRRRGVQQAMILHRVREAQQRGARVAIIHSLPGASTDRNAMRLGFAPSYTKVVLAKRGEGLVPSP